MGVKLKDVAGVLVACDMRRKPGQGQSQKKLEVELNLGSDARHVDALSGAPYDDGTAEEHPLFPGLAEMEQALARDGGGPLRMQLGRKIGPTTITIKSAKGKVIAEVLGANLRGGWQIHMTKDAEDMRSKLVFIGGFASKLLEDIDAHIGADVLVDVKTLWSASDEEKAKSKGGSSGGQKGAKVNLDIERDTAAGENPIETSNNTTTSPDVPDDLPLAPVDIPASTLPPDGLPV